MNCFQIRSIYSALHAMVGLVIGLIQFSVMRSMAYFSNGHTDGNWMTTWTKLLIILRWNTLLSSESNYCNYKIHSHSSYLTISQLVSVCYLRFVHLQSAPIMLLKYWYHQHQPRQISFNWKMGKIWKKVLNDVHSWCGWREWI